MCETCGKVRRSAADGAFDERRRIRTNNSSASGGWAPGTSRQERGMKYTANIIGMAVLVGIVTLPIVGALAVEKPWYPFRVGVTDRPFDAAGKKSKVEYSPVEKAAQKWDLCVSFPHMKDAYWMAVDYGVVKEAERTGVKMTLVEA